MVLGALVCCGLMLRLRTDAQRRQRGRIVRRIAFATWAGLALLLVSGVALTFQRGEGYSWLFAVKHLLVAVILVDATVIHFRLFPRCFRQIGSAELDATYRTMRRVGALSLSAWILVLVLSGLGEHGH
ncbi:MAG: hypothetical protein HY744_18865 [Deltaproteobacteria bacterium]|nr:hypothetical protein [Deltaproteobacteria bacterium]